MMSRCAPLGSIGAFARSSAVFISAPTSARSLREGSILEGVVRRLGRRPDVLLVAAAGRDHPRRAGLALHLEAVLDLPTVGGTDNPLLATGDEPGPAWMAEAPLHLGGEVVAYRRGRARARRPSSRTPPGARIVLGSTALARWREPMGEARRLARELRGTRI